MLIEPLKELYYRLPQGLQRAVLVKRRERIWIDAGLLFIHVPKAAGTSINLALYHRFMGHVRASDVQRWGSPRLKSLPSFAVTRNPWDRLVSAYRFARRGHGIGTYQAGVRRSHRYEGPQFETFERFVTDWLAHKDTRKLDLVFRPQSEFVCDRDGSVIVDHLGTLDDLGPTLEFLRHHLGEAPSIPHTNRSGNDSDYKALYTPKLVELVGQIYREDVERFGYDFDAGAAARVRSRETPGCASEPLMAYRIALLVDDTSVPKWVRDFVEWAERRPEFEIAAVILHPAPQSTRRGFRKFVALARDQGLYTAISRTAFAVLTAIERALVSRQFGTRDHFSLHSIAERIPTQIRSTPLVSKSGFVYRFGEEDLAKIRGLDLDALIRCGNGILKGGVLTAARDGVISIHHADNRVNRGGPAGFWEVLHGQPQTGFIIQRLNEELDGGDVLARGSISTELLYTRNKTLLFDRATTYLGRTLERLARGEAPHEPPHVYDGRLYKTPLLHETVGYVLRTGGRIGRRLVRRALGRHWHWGVAYAFQPWQSAVLWRGKVLPAPRGTFVADPFAVRAGETHFIFVEEYSYRTQKGVISAYRVTPSEAKRIGIVLEEPYHLSFPFLFRYGDDIYMVPESMSDRSIKLYRAADFPTGWTLVRTIAQDVAAVDTMIFELGGRWWMLSTIQGEGEAVNDAELHAFWAPDPLSEWTPHPDNPLAMDASKGRNGGLLRDEDGNVYRVAQRHAFTRYGAGFSIYRIDELSPEGYAESWVQDVEPRFFPRLAGTHHMHEDSGLTVFDFCRDERPR